MPISPYQLDHYHGHGYVIVDDVFERSEFEEMNCHLDRFFEEKEVNAPGEGWLMSLGLQSDLTKSFCEDERVLDLIEDIVKPGIAIYSAKLVSKEPHTDEVCNWHQDDAYYTQISQSKTRMSVWIPLQDTTVEQGCLRIVPDSHKEGLQPVIELEGTCSRGIDREVDPTKEMCVEMQAGQMLLFSALLWHSSQGNQTAHRRRAFIVSYQEATVQGGNADQWQVLRAA